MRGKDEKCGGGRGVMKGDGEIKGGRVRGREGKRE